MKVNYKNRFPKIILLKMFLKIQMLNYRLKMMKWIEEKKEFYLNKIF